MRLLFCSIAALAVLTVLPAGAGADPADTPVVTGCPAGYSLFPVPTPPSPYRLPARLDSPANGGNGDGYVCAFQLPEAVVAGFCHHEPGACGLLQLGLPLYQFMEDDSPAKGAGNALFDFS